jgi:ABC-2 type transport system ATP-binding protein
MIAAERLTKRYGPTVAVDDLSFEVRPGKVTGFLGPNGAGKSTTLRMILALDAPDSGAVTLDGQAYDALRRPLYDVGAMLEGKAIHPGRSAADHLLVLARSNGIPDRRVDEVLDLVGLTSVADKRAGDFSLGMGQRLGIGTALLGDPGTLILDEPVNGLDPDGILWIRNLLRSLAAEGRTVLVSSHLMSEMSLTADQLVVIGHGKLIAESTVDEFIERSAHHFVRVRSTAAGQLGLLLRNQGATIDVEADGALAVTGADAPAVGDLAAAHGIALHELSTQRASLEEAFMQATHDSVEYRTDTDTDIHPAPRQEVSQR